ncbi:hypothetical protein PIB30_055444 [Stylosanthes scabra]|uniref:Uncharacterized protein n=1 Tax=Stylosanthes scabra TaxID=79078 RepID=A0ABU6VIT7_9FABA|nr:hypothetical protein [Stylosanthes scabra]
MTGMNMEQKEQLKEILPCYMLVVQLFKERLGYGDLRSILTLDNLNQLVRDCRLNTHSKEPPCNRAFKVKKRIPKEAIKNWLERTKFNYSPSFNRCLTNLLQTRALEIRLTD